MYENNSSATIIPLKANGAIVKDRLVKADTTAGQCVQASAIADLVIGVALNTAAAGEMVAVQVDGIAQVECAAAVLTAGDEVMPQAAAGNGRIATAAGATARSSGVAQATSTGTAGEKVPVLLNCPAVKGPANA